MRWAAVNSRSSSASPVAVVWVNLERLYQVGRPSWSGLSDATGTNSGRGGVGAGAGVTAGTCDKAGGVSFNASCGPTGGVGVVEQAASWMRSKPTPRRCLIRTTAKTENRYNRSAARTTHPNRNRLLNGAFGHRERDGDKNCKAHRQSEKNCIHRPSPLIAP